MAEERIVAICADDFGLSHGVSVGILEALDAGRLTAVSALVNVACWPAMGRALLRRRQHADIGLHFNLTLGRPLGPMPKFAPDGEFPPVAKVIRMSMAGKLPMDEVKCEIDRQFDRFEAVLDSAPDHVDGHQHVHMLPGVREALLDAMIARKLAGRAWVRHAGDKIHRIAARGAHARKAFAVRGLSLGFSRAANRRGFAVNEGFSGFSDFQPGHNYAAAFATYLRAPGRRHLVMCHPGHVDDDLRAQDPVTITREQELAFLLSPQLPALLEQRGMRLARLSQVSSAPAQAL